jgi:hypothetical protein
MVAAASRHRSNRNISANPATAVNRPGRRNARGRRLIMNCTTAAGVSGSPRGRGDQRRNRASDTKRGSERHGPRQPAGSRRQCAPPHQRRRHFREQARAEESPDKGIPTPAQPSTVEP